MDMLIFKTVIIANGKQIGRTDYRYDLIKNAERIDYESILDHSYLQKINKYLRYENGTMFFKEEEIPKWVINSSLEKHNSQKYFFTYINGYICKSYTMQHQKPLLLDGTKFHFEDYIADDLIDEFWPNITSGVRKKLLNTIRSNGFDLSYFIIPFFNITDTNNQIAMIDEISKHKNYVNREELEEFRVFFKKEKTIRKNFIVKNAKNFLKLIKGDESWFEHIMSIEKTSSEILIMDKDFILPNVSPLNKLLSLINYVKTSKNGMHRIWFNSYCDKYDFFDGLNILDLTIRIPKNDLDLAMWGNQLSICVGGDSYINMCSNNTSFLFLLEKDSEPYIMAHYKNGQKVQLMYKGNARVEGEYLETINKFVSLVHIGSPSLIEMIPKHHIINKEKEYRDRGIIQSDMLKKIKKNLKIIEAEKEILSQPIQSDRGYLRAGEHEIQH